MGVLEEILAELRAIHKELRLIREAMGVDSPGGPPEAVGLDEESPAPVQQEPLRQEIDDDDSSSAYQWLTARGVVVKNQRVSSPADPTLDRLAMFLGDRFSNLSRLHDAIRRSLSLGNSFALSLASRTQAEIADSTQFCTMLSEYAFLSTYRYDKQSKTIYAAPQRVGQVINFFTGEWFERYVYLKLQALFSRSGLRMSCLRNPQIALPNGDDFELDLFFLIDGEPLWVECKTGDYQAYVGKYGAVRKILSVPKERTFLTILDIPEDVATTLTALYEVVVVNEQTLMHAVCTTLGSPDCPEPELKPTPSAAIGAWGGLDLSPMMTSVATEPLATWFKKNHLRPSPEHRRAVLEALPAAVAALDLPATANDLKEVLVEQTGVSKKRLQDILNAMMRGGCLLDEEGDPVSASNALFYRLASDDPDILEIKCLTAYVHAVLEATPSYFDLPQNVAVFEQVVGCEIPESIHKMIDAWQDGELWPIPPE